MAAPRSSSPRPLPVPRRGRGALQHHEPPRTPATHSRNSRAGRQWRGRARAGRAWLRRAVPRRAEPRRATRRAEGRGLPAAAAARARRGWRGGGRRGPGARRERGALPSLRARLRGGVARLGVAELRRSALGLSRLEWRCCRPERSQEPLQSCCRLLSLLVLSKSLRAAAVPAADGRAVSWPTCLRAVGSGKALPDLSAPETLKHSPRRHVRKLRVIEASVFNWL